MNVQVNKTTIDGSVEVLSSKSELHRLLIISALAKDGLPTEITFVGTPSRDVNATIECLRAIGARITISDGKFTVIPITEIPKERVEVCPDESGSTLRFILPVFSALGVNYRVTVNGRLGDRPLSPLYELLTDGNVIMSANGIYPLTVSGKLAKNDFEIAGNVSSQFISGLLMALPLIGGGCVKVTGDYQSKPYVDITVGAMRAFGASITEKNNIYKVSSDSYRSVGKIKAGGDWSNAAFFLSLGAIGGSVTVNGLDGNSFQGDKAVTEILKRFGAAVTFSDCGVTVKKSRLIATDIDASDIPDLIPALSVVASVVDGKTTVFNAGRLRLKESDRIKSVVNMINSLGGCATETSDGITIQGKSSLKGGVVDSFNDHRIVMSAAIASAVCSNPVTILGANAVNKSYPRFFEIVEKIGIHVKEI